MVNRKDRYKEYTDIIFNYKYPFTWEDRSFNYLEVVQKRDWEETQDYMFPIQDNCHLLQMDLNDDD